MTRREQFFCQHAGYSQGPGETEAQAREVGAKALALAEKWAKDNGYEFKWLPDSEGCVGCDCGSEDCKCANRTCHPEVCIMNDENNHTVQSLGSVCDASETYRVVVQAELALEQMKLPPSSAVLVAIESALTYRPAIE